LFATLSFISLANFFRVPIGYVFITPAAKIHHLV